MTTSDQTNATTATRPYARPAGYDGSVREIFGFETDLEVPAFAERNEYVPDYDADYLFDKNTTLALLAGFAITAALWCRAITAPANRPISSRWRRA